MVSAAGPRELLLQLSADGGQTWGETRLVPPHAGTLPRKTYFDVKVNGKMGTAVVSSRFIVSGGDQDVLWRADISKPQPVVQRIYELGLGDVTVGFDAASTGDRFDFPSVALLPSGRIAVAYLDSTASDGRRGHSPALAISDP